MAKTPQVSTLTTLWYATSLYGEKTQIAYVQSIPQLQSAREAITYGALDLVEEQQAKGSRKAETNEIEILYTEQQHKTLKELADSDESYFFFVKYPDSTINEEADSLVMYFSGAVDLSNKEIEIDGMLSDTLTIYRDSAVSESYGFPTNSTGSSD